MSQTRTRRCLLGLTLGVTLAFAAHARPPTAPDTSMQAPILEFEFPGLEIGIAEYEHGPTGTTVFHFPEPVKAAIDVRGGSPGSFQSQALLAMYDAAFTNAVVFSGGSSYGLSAAAGAAEALRDRAESPGDWRQIAFVPGAIIFDLGGRRLNAVTPDAPLGRAALEAARPGRFPLGAQGAGRFAMQGWFFDDPQHSGQGGAVRTLGDVRVGVFTVVNPLGTLVDRSGRVARCGEFDDADCPTIAERFEQRFRTLDAEASASATAGPTANTTITLVIINVDLPIAELRRLAMQVHGSMARAVQPFATINDGDTLIAVTTAELDESPADLGELGLLASETAWDAVLASIPERPAPASTQPLTWSDAELDRVAGRYAFSDWAEIRIERQGDRLFVTGPDIGSLYFPTGERVALTPVSGDEAIIDHGARYRMR
ncbi:MAG: P1 family peptidase, partial [Wenzhouxiangellaceae bacterium]|nr:P1 family peptidase [Wenzhouxiangellaceae bacterium]